MSHELRTPLNAINGFTDVIMKTNLDTEQREAIGIIKSSCEILITLINDILDFSKIESGKLAIERIPFNLRKAMKNIKDLLIKKADEKENKLHLMIDESVPESLLGDKVRINQVVVNLVGNALKFTEKGEVTISIKKSKEVEETNEEITLDFSVKDTGIGIPADKLKSIFERFEQAGQETTRKYGGTGLGLCISKSLVELHKGKLKVWSEVGKGSEFYFTITYGKVNEEQEFKNNLNPKLIVDYETLQDIKILVCEDNVVNIKLLRNLFKNNLSIIEIAENGRIAIEFLIKNTKFDFILMDIHMPEMDGIETTKYIRNVMNLNIPIIGFTASCSKSEREQCLQIGMDDYIMKTFVSDEFYEKLSKIIQGKKNCIEDEVSANVEASLSDESRKDLVLSSNLKRNERKINEVEKKTKVNENSQKLNSHVINNSDDMLHTHDINYNSKTQSEYVKTTSELIKQDIYNNVNVDFPDINNLNCQDTIYETFDVKILNEFSNYEKDFESELLKLFFVENEDQMKKLKIALEEKRIEDVKFYVHKMKSSLLIFKFDRLIGRLEYIEGLLEFEVTVNYELIIKEYDKIKSTFWYVVAQMRNYLETLKL